MKSTQVFCGKGHCKWFDPVALSEAHKASIDGVFKRHRLNVSPEAFAWLCERIEHVWGCARDLDSRTATINATPKEMRAEIGALFRALKKLSGNTHGVLSWHSLDTATYRAAVRVNLRAFIEALQDEQHGSGEEVTMGPFDFAFCLLYEACASAASRKRLPYLGGAASAEEALAAKVGRPPAEDETDFVRALASAYRIATHRKPTDTPAGPFDDLVSAVFAIVQPGTERTSFRRLIRNALGCGMSRKPRLKS